MDFKFKDKYDIDDLVDIMALLRSRDGCPWDREQTHQSIRKNFIEETYEAIDAIDKHDSGLLLEELGDVLLQIVFHSRIASESGEFDFSDVSDGICKKLIVRHPHVFGDVKADDAGEVLKNWDAIKKETKGQKSQSDSMGDIPAMLPALMRSAKVQEKAKKTGFDFENVTQTMEKVEEEYKELQKAIDKNAINDKMEELGDLLFSVVNVSRFIGVDAEEALNLSTEKFIRRFREVERIAAERGIDMRGSGLPLLDELWLEAKKLSGIQ